MDLQMCRRALNFWPAGESPRMFMKRSARCSGRAMQEAKVPRWDTALISNWWRRVGGACRAVVGSPAKTLHFRSPHLARRVVE